MEKPKSLRFFDFHNHPFNKGAVSNDQRTNLSWDPIEIKRTGHIGNCWPIVITDEYQIDGEEIFERRLKTKGISFADIMLMAKEIFNSQASLNDLEKSSTLAVTSLIAMEQAYAETWFLRCILPAISPLDIKIVKAVINKKITYNALFNKELNHIALTKTKKDFQVLKSIKDFKEGQLNTVLCIEGAHNLQTDHDQPKLIPANLKEVKKDTNYRFFYLTLTHLTRQPAAVHCFGTHIRLYRNKGNLTPNFKFQPDPCKAGISQIGEETIHEAYNPDPYTLLIDIKHMSYYSRTMFYKMREGNDAYKKIPIIATHMGVTGQSFEDARFSSIEVDLEDYKKRKACDKVHWIPSCNKYLDTPFNPWSINLYDNDILEILKSGGLIGLN